MWSLFALVNGFFALIYGIDWWVERQAKRRARSSLRDTTRSGADLKPPPPPSK